MNTKAKNTNSNKETTTNKPKQVDRNSRLLHFFIDSILIIIITYFIQTSMFSISLFLNFSDILSVVIFVLVGIFYYISTEYYFQKSPGKFISGKKIVDKNGHKPSLEQIVFRNLARLIPFDAFSYLLINRGIHDQVGNTYLINEEVNAK